ncbi:MAG: DUF167 domain-containing protein [Desulfobacterales bacterium]|nr:DUF167 domain-containing protein [Desulfobacterales bacterium]
MGMDFPYVRVKDGIVIDVKVDPRSSKKEIAGVTEGHLKVRLTAPPVGGRPMSSSSRCSRTISAYARAT